MKKQAASDLPGVKTFVHPKSEKGLPTDVDRTKKQVLPPGAATPGTVSQPDSDPDGGQRLQQYVYNAPGGDTDISSRPQIPGVPGEQYGVPVKEDYEHVTRRTMEGSEEEGGEVRVKEALKGYRPRSLGQRRRKSRPQDRVKRKMRYRRNRNRIRKKTRVWYRKRRRDPVFKRRRKVRRQNKERYRLRYGRALTVPDIAFVVGVDQELGYVRDVSPMTGMVTVVLPRTEGSPIVSFPVMAFLHAVVFLSEEDMDAMFDLIDQVVGPEAYSDLDAEDARVCASLYGVNLDNPEFLQTCAEHVGFTALEEATGEQLAMLTGAIVDGVMEGHSVESLASELVFDEVDEDAFHGEVDAPTRAAGITFQYDQEPPIQDPDRRPFPNMKYEDPDTHEPLPPDIPEPNEALYGPQRRTAAACLRGTGMAWIDPRGRLHKLPGGDTHPSWAAAHLKRHNFALYERVREEQQGELGRIMGRVYTAIHLANEMLKMGWIRVVNAGAFHVWSEREPSRKAWQAAVKVLTDCVVANGLNPETVDVLYDTRSTSHKIKAVDFVGRFGTRRDVDALYEALMAKMGRTAATMDEIATRTSNDVHQRARAVQVRLSRADPKRGIWTFQAAGSKGESYTVRFKAQRKGNVKDVRKAQVQVSCTCNFFRWQGPEHWAKRNSYLYGKPQGTATRPGVKDPQGQHWACKHTIAALNLARNYRLASYETAWSSEQMEPEYAESMARVAEAYLKRCLR